MNPKLRLFLDLFTLCLMMTTLFAALFDSVDKNLHLHTAATIFGLGVMTDLLFDGLAKVFRVRNV